MHLQVAGVCLGLLAVVSADVGMTLGPGKGTRPPPPGPRRCFYRGRFYKLGDRVPSSKRCEICRCTSGGVRCQMPVIKCVTNCPLGYVLVKSNSTKCGSCPKVCVPAGWGKLDCLHGGKWYRNGARVPTTSRCNRCTCSAGRVNCRRTYCTIKVCPPETTPVKLPGACCISRCNPKGMDKSSCKWNGRTYKNGTAVPSWTRCISCKCLSGRVKCGPRFSCSKKSCPVGTFPIKPRHSCCIIRCHKKGLNSSECYWRGSMYKNGTVAPSWSTCLTCKCLSGKVRCGPRFSCSIKTCRPGTVPIRSKYTCCIRRCQEKKVDKYSCKLRGKTYRNGMVVPVWSRCIKCKCSYGKVRCGPRFSCRIKSCPSGTFPIRLRHSCCIIRCQKKEKEDCIWHHKYYKNGTAIFTSSRCYKCRCLNGRVKCERKYSCKIKTCPHGTTPIRSRWTCCILRCRPNSLVCKDNGKTYKFGQRIPQKDPCNICYCLSTGKKCHRMKCRYNCRPGYRPGTPKKGRCCGPCVLSPLMKAKRIQDVAFKSVG